MKRKYSLKRNEEIGQVVKKRRFIKNDVFLIYYQKNEQENARICISVSKKIGKAVVRNKIKRQVREMIMPTFDFEKKCDYVIIIRSKFLENDFSYNLEKLKELHFKILSKN